MKEKIKQVVRVDEIDKSRGIYQIWVTEKMAYVFKLTDKELEEIKKLQNCQKPNTKTS